MIYQVNIQTCFLTTLKHLKIPVSQLSGSHCIEKYYVLFERPKRRVSPMNVPEAKGRVELEPKPRTR